MNPGDRYILIQVETVSTSLLRLDDPSQLAYKTILLWLFLLKYSSHPPRTMVCWKGSIYYLVPVQSSSFSPFPLFSLFSPCFLESMKSHGISTFFSLIRGFTTCLWIRKVEFMFAGITSFGWGLKYSWKGT